MILSHQLIEHVRGISQDTTGWTIFSPLEDFIRSAVHFDLGRADILPVMSGDKSFTLAKPPYPLTLFQFDFGEDHYIAKFLVLFKASSGDGDPDVFLATQKIRGSGDWEIAGDTYVFDRGNGKIRFGVDERTGLSNYEHNLEIRKYVYAVLRNAFCVLACTNVRTVDIEAPVALNKKRAAKGKPPIYAHKTLVLSVGEQVVAENTLGGTHASPRVHLRRGHIRRLPSGNVWVQPCVVGDKTRGVLSKDYEVRSEVA